jgi:hypothetical protein
VPRLALIALSINLALPAAASALADDAAKEACEACIERCAFTVLDCREAACRAAGGKPEPGTCHGAQDDPRRLTAVEACSREYDACQHACRATASCSSVLGPGQ